MAIFCKALLGVVLSAALMMGGVVPVRAANQPTATSKDLPIYTREQIQAHVEAILGLNAAETKAAQENAQQPMFLWGKSKQVGFAVNGEIMRQIPNGVQDLLVALQVFLDATGVNFFQAESTDQLGIYILVSDDFNKSADNKLLKYLAEEKLTANPDEYYATFDKLQDLIERGVDGRPFLTRLDVNVENGLPERGYVVLHKNSLNHPDIQEGFRCSRNAVFFFRAMMPLFSHGAQHSSAIKPSIFNYQTTDAEFDKSLSAYTFPFIDLLYLFALYNGGIKNGMSRAEALPLIVEAMIEAQPQSRKTLTNHMRDYPKCR